MPSLPSDKRQQTPKPQAYLVCPLTVGIFLDPVIAEDALMYERSAIEKYIKSHHGEELLSPITQEKMGPRIRPAPLPLKNHIEFLNSQHQVSTASKPETFITDNLVCPITHEVFLDPVIAEDDLLYERRAIEKHIKIKYGGELLSPITREKMGPQIRPAPPQLKKHIEFLVESGHIGEPEATKWKERAQEKKDADELIKAAEAGDINAMYYLGVCHHNCDFGFEKDYEMAYHWFDAAFDAAQSAGSISGMAHAGFMLANGEGKPQNIPRGLMNLGIAAGKGSIIAAFHLGDALAGGKYGLEVDKKEAIGWFKKSLGDTSLSGDLGLTEKAKEMARQRIKDLASDPVEHAVD